MDHHGDATTECCADCGGVAGEGISLKTCKACMTVKYCNANCQRNHWPKHKKECEQLYDEALFKDPPAKEECPICFLPMPIRLISSISLPPATILSVPIYDYAVANVELSGKLMEQHFPCCGKSLCLVCLHSCFQTGNQGTCPYCKTQMIRKTIEEDVKDIMKRVKANDAGSMCELAMYFRHGEGGLQQDRTKAMELFARAADLGSNQAHDYLGAEYYEGGDLKKAKFHLGAAAMAGNEKARCNLGNLEGKSGNVGRGLKHLKIAASAGHHEAMHNLLVAFRIGMVNRDTIDSTLAAYNTSCVEMRTEARDKYMSDFKNRQR